MLCLLQTSVISWLCYFHVFIYSFIRQTLFSIYFVARSTESAREYTDKEASSLSLPASTCAHGPALSTRLVSFRRGPKGCYSHTHLFIMLVLAWAPKGKKADVMSSFANGEGGYIATKQASGILCGQVSCLCR